MKRLLIILLLFFGVAAQAQLPPQKINQKAVYRVIGADSGLIVPRDTTINRFDSAYTFLSIKGGIARYFDSTIAKRWQVISSGGGEVDTTILATRARLKHVIDSIVATIQVPTLQDVTSQGNITTDFIRAQHYETTNGLAFMGENSESGGFINKDLSGNFIGYLIGNIVHGSRHQLQEIDSTEIGGIGDAMTLFNDKLASNRLRLLGQDGVFRTLAYTSDIAGSPVTSVFTRTGAVTAQESDYSAFYPLLSGSYSNPSWINSLAWSKITSAPSFLTNITGYVAAGTNTTLSGTGTIADPYKVNASAAGLTGAIGTGQIAFGGASNVIAGSNYMRFDSATKYTRFEGLTGAGVSIPDATFSADGSAPFVVYGARMRVTDGTVNVRLGLDAATMGYVGPQSNHPWATRIAATNVIYTSTGRNTVIGTGGVTSSDVVSGVGLKAKGGFAIDGPFRPYAVSVADANYLMTTSDFLITVTTLTAPRTITLANPNTIGSSANPHFVEIKDESGAAATHNITLSISSGTFEDGTTSRTINTNYGILKLYSKGGTKYFLR